MKSWILAVAIAWVPLVALAQTSNETFMGYIPCVWVSLPSPPYPSGANKNGCVMQRGNSVRFTFGNGLTVPECLAYQEASQALTGMGFCEPPVSR